MRRTFSKVLCRSQSLGKNPRLRSFSCCYKSYFQFVLAKNRIAQRQAVASRLDYRAPCLYLRKITCCRVHAAILVLMNYERATNEQPGACVLLLLNRNIQTAPTGGTSQPEYLLNNKYFSIITALTL